MNSAAFSVKAVRVTYAQHHQMETPGCGLLVISENNLDVSERMTILSEEDFNELENQVAQSLLFDR